MAAPDTPRPPRRWLLGSALALSLAVNLLVLGVVLGALWGRGGLPERAARIDFGTMPLIGALEEDDRAALRAGWRAEGPALPDIRAERAAERAALAAALRARPFEPAAVTAVLEAQTARLAERQALTHRLLLERLEAMTDPQRAAFADRLEAGRNGPDGRPLWRRDRSGEVGEVGEGRSDRSGPQRPSRTD